MKTIRLIILLWVLFTPPTEADEIPLAERPYFSYYGASAQYLPVLDSAVASARKELIGILNDSLDYKPNIYIENSLESFRARIKGNIPDWGAAVAIPYREMIVIKSPANFRLGKSLYELVKHEYAHLALHERFGFADPPRWLDEGIAMYVAFEWSWSASFALSRASAFGGLMTLEEIQDLNMLDWANAEIAYAQSYMAVKYILEDYDITTMNILIDELAGQKPLDSAMMAATGSNLADFEEEYFNFLTGRYNLLTLFIDMSYLWLFLAVVVILGFLLRYRKKKQVYDRWDEEENYQSTDFDYGDPDNPEEIEDEDKPWA